MSENDKTANMSDQLKSQESQLRSKYGNIDKRKGNSLLMKKLASKKQYFDSGDYNMQKERPKPMMPTPLSALNPGLLQPVLLYHNRTTFNKLYLVEKLPVRMQSIDETSPQSKPKGSSLANVSN